MSIRIPLRETHPYSNPSLDDAGQYCSDGIDKSDKVEIVCRFCGQLLFKSDDLNWMEFGYRISPGMTLTKKYYDGNKEIITCPRCKKSSPLSFFSYMG